MASNPGRLRKAGPASGLRLAIALGGIAVFARAETTFYQARIAPILDKNCVGCHGPEKQKAKLRLDTHAWMMKGADSGEVVKPGDVQGSELYRRILLPASDEEVMPSDGKPLLSPNEKKLIEMWIAGGASATKVLSEFPGAPSLSRPEAPAVALAPDWQPRAREIAALEKSLGVRLVPRSRVATDGLILRTASAPGRCTDAVLARLEPIAELIVDAELARTKVTDAGMETLASFDNLRAVDLTRTAVTSAGVTALTRLPKLENVNLTSTAVDEAGVAKLKSVPTVKRIWLFDTKAEPPPAKPQVVAK